MEAQTGSAAAPSEILGQRLEMGSGDGDGGNAGHGGLQRVGDRP